MTLESFQDVREYYDVTVPWATAAGVGFGVATTVVCFEFFCWWECRKLWSTEGRDEPIPVVTPVHINMDWLM